VTAIVAEIRIDGRQSAAVRLIYEAHRHFPRAVVEGLLQRVRAGRPLFHGVGDLFKSANLVLEDDALVEIVLSGDAIYNDRTEAAAAVLGPQATGRIIEAFIHPTKQAGIPGRGYDPTASNRHRYLKTRIDDVPSASFIAAIRTIALEASNADLSELAELIAHHLNDDTSRGRTLTADEAATIVALVESWGNRLLTSDDATRRQLTTIATLLGRAKSPSLLPTLKRLLDEELRRWRAFIRQAKAENFRGGAATDEARISWTWQYQAAFNAIGGPGTAALMGSYLLDEDFGQVAALVIAETWHVANEPDGDRRFRGGVDSSRVEARRAARAANPEATSAEAEAIFGAVESLIADETAGENKRRAVTLGAIAARLPHGDRVATIEKLLSFTALEAHVDILRSDNRDAIIKRLQLFATLGARADLLQNLVLSGESIDIGLVKNGLAEALEANQTEWSLHDRDVKVWLRLLPFVSCLLDAIAVVRELPERFRTSSFLDELLREIGSLSSDDAENVLFQIAEGDPRFYGDQVWRDVAIRRDTASAARKIVDLVAHGAFESIGLRPLDLQSEIAGLISKRSELRAYVYELLRSGPMSPGLTLLARSVAEEPDAEGLLLLTQIEVAERQSFVSHHTIVKAVTKHVPDENWKGVYNIVAVPTAELRRRLLAMTSDGGPLDVAARCLTAIDRIRDENSAPESEPRHPDLASGRPWPILVRDPDATDET